MKKVILLVSFLLFETLCFAQVSSAVGNVSPKIFEENQSITVTFTLTVPISTDLYLWAWAQDANGSNIGTPNNGAWTASSVASKMTQTGSSTYTYVLTPSIYYSATGIKKIGFLIKK